MHINEEEIDDELRDIFEDLQYSKPHYCVRISKIVNDLIGICKTQTKIISDLRKDL